MTPTNEAGHGLPELPRAIGLICGRRLTPEGTREFFGFFYEDREIGLKEQVYTADQMRQYAIDYAAALALSRGVPADMVLVPKVPAEAISLDRDLDVLPPWPALPEPWTTASVTYAEDGETCTQRVWTEKQLRAFGKACAQAALDAAAPAAAGAQGEVKYLSCTCHTDDAKRLCMNKGHCVVVTAQCTPQPAAADGGVRELPTMTPERCASFLSRFKSDEKMLGPNEQLALDYALAALSSHRQAGDLSKFRELAERWRDGLKDEDEITAMAHGKFADELLALVEKGAGNG